MLLFVCSKLIKTSYSDDEIVNQQVDCRDEIGAKLEEKNVNKNCAPFSQQIGAFDPICSCALLQFRMHLTKNSIWEVRCGTNSQSHDLLRCDWRASSVMINRIRRYRIAFNLFQSSVVRLICDSLITLYFFSSFVCDSRPRRQGTLEADEDDHDGDEDAEDDRRTNRSSGEFK
jgi:hypothetical protein